MAQPQRAAQAEPNPPLPNADEILSSLLACFAKTTPH